MSNRNTISRSDVMKVTLHINLDPDSYQWMTLNDFILKIESETEINLSESMAKTFAKDFGINLKSRARSTTVQSSRKIRSLARFVCFLAQHSNVKIPEHIFELTEPKNPTNINSESK